MHRHGRRDRTALTNPKHRRGTRTHPFGYFAFFLPFVFLPPSVETTDFSTSPALPTPHIFTSLVERPLPVLHVCFVKSTAQNCLSVPTVPSRASSWVFVSAAPHDFALKPSNDGGGGGKQQQQQKKPLKKKYKARFSP